MVVLLLYFCINIHYYFKNNEIVPNKMWTPSKLCHVFNL